jgi:predicted transglutaminase-like cysteine proteinase
MLGCVLAASAANAGEVVSSQTAQNPNFFMRVFGPAQPPYGFVRFCDASPKDCGEVQPEQSRFVASPDRLSELDDINRTINKQIKPETDLEIYGTTELWTLPKTRGDCEDYALLKRKLLIERGWPESSLLLTVVRDEKGEGHAVLTARTAQGDFVLDNKVDDVKVWSSTPYEFIMRQSYLNPRVWVALDPTQTTTPSIAAGVPHDEVEIAKGAN